MFIWLLALGCNYSFFEMGPNGLYQILLRGVLTFQGLKYILINGSFCKDVMDRHHLGLALPIQTGIRLLPHFK